MTRWIADKPQGLAGIGASSCMSGASALTGYAATGFVMDHPILTPNDGTARPMGCPGGSPG
jgi:hypothetical protein